MVTKARPLRFLFEVADLLNWSAAVCWVFVEFVAIQKFGRSANPNFSILAARSLPLD